MLHQGSAAVPAECSIAIVGGGLAGLELASALAAHGVGDVLVLEAGEARETRHVNVARNPDAAARAWLQPETDDAFRRPWTSENPPHYIGAAGLRQRLGGRSLYWYGVVLPIEPWALAAWPAEVRHDLAVSWRGGPSLYERAGSALQRWGGDSTSAATVQSVAGLDLRPTPEAIRRVPDDSGRWYAYSPLDLWRDPTRGGRLEGPDGCRIVTGVEVLEVVQDDSGCRGVRFLDRASGVCGEVRAAEVVLSAGTLESSRLAVQALTARGALEQPRLSGLNDHLVQGFFARFGGATAAELLERIPPGNYFAACGGRSNVYAETVVARSGEVILDVRCSGEQLPSAECYVECDPVPGAMWPYRVHASLAAADREVLAVQQQVLCRIWADLAPGGPAPRFGDFDAPKRTNEAVLPEFMAAAPTGTAMTWSSHLGSEDHEGGTLPLGGLLTARHEFAALPHLHATGPATFPRAGAANPGLTVLALTHRLAALLAGADPPAVYRDARRGSPTDRNPSVEVGPA